MLFLRGLFDRRREVDLTDAEAIARDAPELAGMSIAKGAEFILAEIARFEAQHTASEQRELMRRLRQTRHPSWWQDGRKMGWWGNLVVLRTYKRELRESKRRG